MVTGLRECPDAPNGDSYDPTFRVAIHDTKSKRNGKPYWHSDAFADCDGNPNGDPAAFYHAARYHNLAVNEPGPYQPRTFGMSRQREKRTWGK